MNVVGLDPSLTAFGWATASDTGVWKSKKLRGYGRTNYLIEQVLDLMRGTHPDLVVVEGYSYASQGKAVYQIAGLGEMVRYVLWYNRIPWVTFAPGEVKKWATGNGSADKEWVKRSWEEATGLVFKDDNACDAHVLMCMGIYLKTGQGVHVGPPSIVEKHQIGEIRS